MRTYRRTQWFILSAIFLYWLVGNLPRYWSKPEIYPISSWELFSYVPNELADYGLRVTAVDNQALPEALYFEAATQLFDEAQSITAYVNIQTLGQAIDTGQAEQSEILRSKLEQQYLQIAQPLRYEIVRRRSLPLVRWKTGDFSSEEVIAQFEATQ